MRGDVLSDPPYDELDAASDWHHAFDCFGEDVERLMRGENLDIPVDHINTLKIFCSRVIRGKILTGNNYNEESAMRVFVGNVLPYTRHPMRDGRVLDERMELMPELFERAGDREYFKRHGEDYEILLRDLGLLRGAARVAHENYDKNRKRHRVSDYINAEYGR